MYTEKIYYKDSHIFKFCATVLECRDTEKGPAVILDKTAFFPEGGGQQADTGSLGAAKVLDVQELRGEILHYCDRALNPGETVEGCLDAEQRLTRMQNHSGEHVVSGLDRELSWEQLMEIETLANRAVRDDLPVSCAFPEPEELKTLEYRSKLELTENVRIVEIPGVDRCACCAPHVQHTGEIGLIKVLESERHRGGVRLNLACGMLALKDYRTKQDNISAISQALSAKRHETAAAVERLLQEQQKTKERIAALSLELVRHMAASREKTEGNICVFDDVLDEVALRELVNMLMEKCEGIAAAFSGDDERGYRYIMGSRNVDLKARAKELNALINGRGGGKPRMIQGSTTAAAESIARAMERDFR